MKGSSSPRLCGCRCVVKSKDSFITRTCIEHDMTLCTCVDLAFGHLIVPPAVWPWLDNPDVPVFCGRQQRTLLLTPPHQKMWQTLSEIVNRHTSNGDLNSNLRGRWRGGAAAPIIRRRRPPARGFQHGRPPSVTCVVRTRIWEHQLAGGNNSWCPRLESRTTHRRSTPATLRASRRTTTGGSAPRLGVSRRGRL